MTSSPCKNCPNRYKPKDECIKDCKIIRTLQGVYLSNQEASIMSAIDYSEEGRFSINYSPSNSIS